MSTSLHHYHQAAQSAQVSDWPEATNALHLAFHLTPPKYLTDDACQTLRLYLDDIVLVGQRLSTLTPTLDLLKRMLAVIS